MRSAAVFVALVAGALTAACGGGDDSRATTLITPSSGVRMEVTSSYFAEGESIPVSVSCDGDNRSPDLAWSGVPAGTKSLVMIADDPDASGFVHWLVYSIPASATSLPAGITNEATLTDGAVQGKNSRGNVGYTGPCPPSGTHTYVFTVYALDTNPSLEPSSAAKDVLQAVEGHILGTGVLTGRYGR